MLTFARYLAFQVPGWGIALALAWGLDVWSTIPRSMIGSLLAAFVVKDFLIYPFVRSAYEHRPHDPGHRVVGACGKVVVALDPDGWVEVGHERWRARRETDGPMLDVGEKVEIAALRGHTVLVRAEGKNSPSAASASNRAGAGSAARPRGM
ncbi:MAG: NfeD family protein [Deltaproteobacteria bacterium]|nr:NfeD family protein [Deltaproteobacteria bacterium]MBW2695472.1 NfeD family protein [Deltaproteobacteria bacterium]